MLISYNWLSEFFSSPLPSPVDVSEALTMHSFEVEEITKLPNDMVLNVKVLPNRAHDCLSHYGIAKEISAILNIPLSKNPFEGEVNFLQKNDDFSVKVESSNVARFTTVRIKNIKVCPSPEWLKSRLESIGQKSINNIVDLTNYVMFDIGQPLHAFDEDKISIDGNSKIVVKDSKEKESVVTLDGAERHLPEGVILIANGEKILGIGGLKGGKDSEISDGTKNIVIEAANFNPQRTRKSSTLLNLRTDASVRFENSIAPEITVYALKRLLELTKEVKGFEESDFRGFTDYYPNKLSPYKVGVSLIEINSLLGTNLKDHDVEEILKRLMFTYEKISVGDVLKNQAKLYLGKEYKNPSSMRIDAPEYFSCSSLISYLYAQAGVYMPSISIDKYVFGKKVLENDLIFGDLVFSNTGKGNIRKETVEYMKGTKVPEGIDHVAMYIGDNRILHSSELKGVSEMEITEYVKVAPVVGYRRIIDDLNEVRFVVTSPFERLDLRLKEDLIEEIGSIYGLLNIPSVFKTLDIKPEVSKEFYYVTEIRNLLKNLGFSEVITYAMREVGEVEIANPIAKDKAFLRDSLFNGLDTSLNLNGKNAPLLGIEEIKIFEIGKVFPNQEKELLSLGIGVLSLKNVKNKEKETESILEVTIKELEEKLGTKIKVKREKNIITVDLEETLKNLPVCDSYQDFAKNIDKKYETPSVYPFVLRDIALFVPKEVDSEKIKTILIKEGGALLVKETLFDVFEKEEKVSYAFRLVFQSHEKTLSDNEVNVIMSKINEALSHEKDWVIR